jgi:hypothetical protein
MGKDILHELDRNSAGQGKGRQAKGLRSGEVRWRTGEDKWELTRFLYAHGPPSYVFLGR